ncbi:hypothetical protein IAU60_006716 [Kwoniella sp. DSM 27419]
MILPTQRITINRNLRPVGTLGNADLEPVGTVAKCLCTLTRLESGMDGTLLALPLLAGAGSGFEEGRRRTLAGDDTASESLRDMRDPMTSYLHQHLSQSPSSPSAQLPDTSAQHRINLNSAPLLTPPQSYTESVDIPRHPSTSVARPNPAMSLPLTPVSLSSMSSGSRDMSPPGHKSTVTPDKQERQIISLISTIFPSDFTSIAPLSTTLEIVTPPSNVLKGFIHDHTSRTVYIHLPPNTSSAQDQRPEHLSPNFSQVLRPHDPLLSTSPPSASRASNYALDIKEFLTALLDLASEALEASYLVLVLDRAEREQEGLGELLHSLMYVGGQVIKPGAMEGGWRWDPMKWVLVGMEL